MFSFFIFGALPTAIFASWIVAYFVWEPHIKECNSVIYDEGLYESKYPFLDEKIVHEDNDEIKDVMVIEETPQGYCALRYNLEEKVYEVWADADIQYRYLETVARHFVQKFRCENFFINRFEELTEKIKARRKTMMASLEREEEKEEEEEEEKVEEKAKDPNSVFAVLEKAKVQKENPQSLIISERANKYIKKGRLNDMKFFENYKPSSPRLTFSDFVKSLGNN